MSMPVVFSEPVFRVVSCTKPSFDSQSEPKDVGWVERCTRLQKNGLAVLMQFVRISVAPMPAMNLSTLMSK